ncbi:hypothetical protein Trco_001307 [Trichoderma cornu-damae]|uniref:Zn(2)-C6 fungal-type domain-containing protein n=1 Tax=Trichoderma cornu-damae TaxID=654480 RepID=A0A9P8U0S3_9HYPO|nr:hypothetical protein Trco_001307 [Trichoderma cornu-damae]
MREIKRRTRTGCLTCRARRVKCDERKPTRNRCTAANVECAGYAPKRRIDVRAPNRHRSASQSQQNSPAGESAMADDDDVRSERFQVSPQDPPGSTPSGPASGPASAPSACSAPCAPFPRPQFRHDGLPLVGLPSNPRPSQQPCAASREVLAYHQFCFRTLPVLFPADHLPFWRDRLCDEAWCIEYAQRGILALGCMHRAALMISMLGENYRNRGMDTKVIAVQTYTQALQELSSRLDEAEKSLDVLSAVLVLMAYFECFASNIPAAYGHVRTANYYFTALKSNTSLRVDDLTLESLQTALQNLTWTCYMAVPFPAQDAKKMESEAYVYLYQTMRLAATHAANNSSKTLPNGTYSTDAPVSSEEMDRSFLPVLYITGQCSPQPSWLRWIAQLMEQMGEQGLFNGFVLSASLKILHRMELSHNLPSADRIERYPNPALRVVSSLIPDTNSRGFVCYYAKPPGFNSGWINRDTLTYYPIAHARFSPEPGDDGAARRDFDVYDEQRSGEEQFASEWILSRPVAGSWQSRSSEVI